MSFLIFSMVLNCMGFVILQLSDTQVSYNKLGLLEAFKDLPIAFVSLFAVNFIHRLGNKKSLLIALFIVGVCCSILPFLQDFWFFKIWFSIIGICFGMAKIAVYGLIRNNISTENELAKVMSSVEASFMLGIFLVNIGFGWLLASKYAADWKFGFWLIAVLAFFNFLILFKTELVDGGTRTQVFSKSILAQFFRRRTVLFFSIIFGIVFVEQNFNSWLLLFNLKFKFYIKESSRQTYRNRIHYTAISICNPLVGNGIIDVKCIKNLNSQNQFAKIAPETIGLFFVFRIDENFRQTNIYTLV